MVGRRALAALVVVGAVAAFGCSDDSAGGKGLGERTTLPAAVLEQADELALSVLVGRADLPDSGWSVFEAGMDDLRKLYRPPTETDAISPPECRPLEPPPYVDPGSHGLIAMQTRSITATDGVGAFGVVSSAMVFERPSRASEFMDRTTSAVEPGWSQACLDARGPGESKRGTETARYALPDERASRMTTVLATAPTPTEFAIEIHTFQRGRVVASYTVLGEGNTPRGIDHQGLLEAFEARVVAAQE